MDFIPPDATAKIYVATMDEETCPGCASRHGLRLAVDAETHVIPNPYCTCRHGCRCMWEWER
jgi:hypothetical protein